MAAANQSLWSLFGPPPAEPRLRLWCTVTVRLWLACLAAVLLYVARDYQRIALALDVIFNNQAYDIPRDQFIRRFFANDLNDVDSSIFFHLWLAVCGLAALGKLALLTPYPANWTNFRQFTWLVVCLAVVAGLPLSAVVALGFDALPPGWVLDIIRFVLTPVMLPFAGLVSIAGGAVVVGVLVFAYTFLFLHLPLLVFGYLNERDIRNTVIDQQKQGLAVQIFRLHLWLRGEPLPDIPDDSKGARFATPQEVVALHHPDAPEAMTFGHIGNAAFALKTDKHVLIMASTRSGKGVTLIIPHLLRYQGSAFVLDPKGENARATGRCRAALNGKVHVLDPFGISGKPQARFNPLARFTPENMEAESKALAAALFVIGERERDHWTAAGQQLLAAIILYVYVAADIPKAKKDLPTVRRILLGGLKPALDAMTHIDAADGLLRDLATSFLETPEREFGSIVSTAQRQTEILDNPFMIACLAAAGKGEEVDFKAWHAGTMTVYLCLSAPKFPVFNRWLRLVLTSALDEMTDVLTPPKLPVCFMLDELATLGHLDAVENAVGLAAGYGIQLICVFQDVAQMRDLYKGRWASFIGNAGVRALFNLDDYETAEYWSKFIGGTLVETRSSQQDIYGISSGQNVSEAMRPMLPPDQLMMEFASGKMLVLTQGAHPIVSERVPYWRDDSLKGLWDDPRGPIKPAKPASPGYTDFNIKNK
jgi:type IV secretion system protein VirD4